MPAITSRPKEPAEADHTSILSSSVSASSSGSANEIESQSESGGSDSLDNLQPRKRRRVEDDEEDEEDDKEDTEPKVVLFAAPSRIKRNTIPEPVTPALVTKSLDAEAPPKGISAPVDPNATFESLDVRPWLVQSLANMAIKRPTGIQKGCIPEILRGRDCIGGSRTGSGKTIAFAVPILQKLFEDPSGIFAVVLTPTRELALQIYEQFKAISSPYNLKALLIIGGNDMRTQATALAQRPHLVIATPGRLADHIRTSGEDTIYGLRKVRFVVFDEADRLLADNGPGSMLPDLEECLEVLPPKSKRQTLLFTATMTPEVRALKDQAREPGKKPVFICEVDTQVMAIPASLNQLHLQVPVTHREHYLHMFLLTDANKDKSIVIFCNRTETATYLHHLLNLLQHQVTSLHSKLPQRQRVDNLGRFRAGAARILVATDVASRGLDIPEVSIVLNYDLPRDPDIYIHRVGRTARAGRKGDAVTFVGQRDVELVHAIEERVGRPMEAWTEEGVNLETRVIRDALKVVGEKKREALLDIEENREVGSKRKRGKQKLRAT